MKRRTPKRRAPSRRAPRSKKPSVGGRFLALLAGFALFIGVQHYLLVTVGPLYL